MRRTSKVKAWSTSWRASWSPSRTSCSRVKMTMSRSRTSVSRFRTNWTRTGRSTSERPFWWPSSWTTFSHRKQTFCRVKRFNKRLKRNNLIWIICALRQLKRCQENRRCQSCLSSWSSCSHSSQQATSLWFLLLVATPTQWARRRASLLPSNKTWSIVACPLVFLRLVHTTRAMALATTLAVPILDMSQRQRSRSHLATYWATSRFRRIIYKEIKDFSDTIELSFLN